MLKHGDDALASELPQKGETTNEDNRKIFAASGSRIAVESYR
jgi:hypothetical protein